MWAWSMVSTCCVLNPELTEFGNVLRRRRVKDNSKYFVLSNWKGEVPLTEMRKMQGRDRFGKEYEVFMLGPVKYEIALKHPSENAEVEVRQKSLEAVGRLD